MTTVVTQALNKVLDDLTLNRNRLSDANDGLKQQLEVGATQLAHFDLVIAAIKTVQADEDKLEQLLTTVSALGIVLPVVEAPPVSQPAAGSTDTSAATPAAEDSANGAGQDGIAVANDPIASV